MANTSRITALMHWLQAGAPGPDSFLQVVAEIGGRLNAAGVPAAQVASAWPRRRSLKPAAHMYASPIVFGFSAPCDETISSKAEKCSFSWSIRSRGSIRPANCVKSLKSVKRMVTDSWNLGRTRPRAVNSSAMSRGKMPRNSWSAWRFSPASSFRVSSSSATFRRSSNCVTA